MGQIPTPNADEKDAGIWTLEAMKTKLKKVIEIDNLTIHYPKSMVLWCKLWYEEAEKYSCLEFSIKVIIDLIFHSFPVVFSISISRRLTTQKLSLLVKRSPRCISWAICILLDLD